MDGSVGTPARPGWRGHGQREILQHHVGDGVNTKRVAAVPLKLGQQGNRNPAGAVLEDVYGAVAGCGAGAAWLPVSGPARTRLGGNK